MNHLSRHNLSSDSLFGYRKNRITILQLLTVMEDRAEALDDNLQVTTLYLEFKKAFDSVPHKSLIKKLEGYGMKGSLLTWLENTFKRRQQRVVINGNISKKDKCIIRCTTGIYSQSCFVYIIYKRPVSCEKCMQIVRG